MLKIMKKTFGIADQILIPDHSRVQQTHRVVEQIIKTFAATFLDVSQDFNDVWTYHVECLLFLDPV